MWVIATGGNKRNNNGNGEDFQWFTADQIRGLGYDQATKRYIATILPHTKWALNMKYSR